MGADVEHQIHTDYNVEQKVTMKQPITCKPEAFQVNPFLFITNRFVTLPRSMFTWVVRSESEHHVAVVRHGYCILARWQIEMSVQKTPSVQIKRVFQVDLFNVLVR